MTDVPNNQQASAFNWLEAISGDNGSFDPRTYRVHQTTTDNMDNLTHIDPRYTPTPRRQSNFQYQHPAVRVETWAQNNQQISESTESTKEKLEEDWENTSWHSDAETIFEGLDVPINLEAEPPFPTTSTESNILGSHNIAAILSAPSQREGITYLARQQTTSSETSSTTSSCDDALLPFCRPLPTTSIPSGASNSEAGEPEWLIPLAGKIITDKAKKACRKLRKKLSREEDIVEDRH